MKNPTSRRPSRILGKSTCRSPRTPGSTSSVAKLNGISSCVSIVSARSWIPRAIATISCSVGSDVTSPWSVSPLHAHVTTLINNRAENLRIFRNMTPSPKSVSNGTYQGSNFRAAGKTHRASVIRPPAIQTSSYSYLHSPQYAEPLLIDGPPHAACYRSGLRHERRLDYQCP